MVTQDEHQVRAPARLRALTSWQASKVTTIGARLTGLRMPLVARSDFAVLAALEEHGPLSQADLGRCLGLDRNDVNAIMSRLLGDDLVARRVDPEDRRRNIVETTADGTDHLRRLQKYADDVQDELLDGLSREERAQLHTLLEKVLLSHTPQPA